MLICDLAETYQILDYRSLPPILVATLVAGLRENSRLNMKKNDVKASQDTIFLATIADRLGAIMAWALGVDRPDIIVSDLLGDTYDRPEQTQKREIMTYDSPEEFMKERYGVE